MAFKTESREINEIFNRTAIYIVPRYQRDYVWNEINWRELWTDLKFTADNDEIPWSHFIGTIVLNKKNDMTNGLERYEIIDGQQRLMTIYLLLITIYSNCIRNGKKDLSNYICENFLISKTKRGNKEIKIDNDYYKDDLKHIIDASTYADSVNAENKLLEIFDFFDKKLNGVDSDYLDKFLDSLLKTKLVEIISNEDEEIYNIFEVLNARGQKLRQMELLKNHVMKYMQPRDEQFIDKAKTTWRNIQNNVEHLKNPDILLQHFAKCYVQKNAENSDSIYRLFKEEIEVTELKEFLEDLEKFSGVYKRMTKGDKDFKLIEYFHIKGNKQIRPLICAIDTLFMKNIINESVRNQSMEQLVNFFFLFNTTQQTSNRTDKIISSFSYGVYRCETVNEFKIIFTELLILLQNFIIDKNFKELFKNNSSFRYSNKNKLYSRNGRLVRYILSKMYDLNQQDTIINQSNISIEHLLSDDENGNNSFLWHLTLTSEEINCRELKNKDIKTKVQILKEKSTIKSNQELCNYMRGEVFDFEKRREDIMKCIFEKMFVFSTEVFHLTEGDCIRYREIEKLVKNDEHLMKILKKHGLNFEKHLNNNLELNNLKQRWDNIKLDS